jgi:very-short-patch-repair endonuclease
MAGKITKTIEDIKEYVESISNCKLLTTDEYKGTNQHMDFMCECGKVFTITLKSFNAKKNKMCRSCSNVASNTQRLNIEDIKSKIFEISECELLENVYINNRTKMTFRCECGETFKTSWEEFNRNTPNNTNKKCNKCTNQYSWKYEEVVDYVIQNSNCKLLENEYKALHTKMRFQCECGNEFKATFREFRDRLKRRCGDCARVRSSFEEHIYNVLNKFKIEFEEQYVYDDCIGVKGVNKMPFDFYLPKYNLLIEADGQHHYKRRFGRTEQEFIDALHNDNLKNEYCKKNNINLLRIPYWEASKSEKIILDEINKYVNTEVI